MKNANQDLNKLYIKMKNDQCIKEQNDNAMQQLTTLLRQNPDLLNQLQSILSKQQTTTQQTAPQQAMTPQTAPQQAMTPQQRLIQRERQKMKAAAAALGPGTTTTTNTDGSKTTINKKSGHVWADGNGGYTTTDPYRNIRNVSSADF